MPIPIVRIDEIPNLDKSAAEGKAILVAASEIVRLRDEILRLTSAGLNAASGEAIKEDEANYYHTEIERLGARLDQFAETAQLQGAELALLRQQLADANTQHNQTLKTLHDITNEYQALWDVLVAYMNAPGHSAEAEYTALVRQTWQSRFWNSQSS